MTIRNVFARIVGAIALLSAGGCIWGAGNIPTTIAWDRRMNRERPEADRRVDSLHTAVIRDRDIYFACVEDYARRHARSSATAAEVADAAGADCHTQFSAIAMALRDMPEAAAYPYRYEPDVAQKVREQWQASNDTVLAGLADQGRQRAVRAVVEGRPE